MHGPLTRFGYERTEVGWVNSYMPNRPLVTWKMLLRDEATVEITSLPYTVGGSVSSSSDLARLPIGTVMVVFGGLIPYTKIARHLWIRYADGEASEKLERDLHGVVFIIKYLPKEKDA